MLVTPSLATTKYPLPFSHAAVDLWRHDAEALPSTSPWSSRRGHLPLPTIHANIPPCPVSHVIGQLSLQNAALSRMRRTETCDQHFVQSGLDLRRQPAAHPPQHVLHRPPQCAAACPVHATNRRASTLNTLDGNLATSRPRTLRKHRTPPIGSSERSSKYGIIPAMQRLHAYILLVTDNCKYTRAPRRSTVRLFHNASFTSQRPLPHRSGLTS